MSTSELDEEMSASLYNSKYAIGIFVDLKKAFLTMLIMIHWPKKIFFLVFVVWHIGEF